MSGAGAPASSGALSGVLKDFDRVKKPRLDPTNDLIDKVIAELVRCRDALDEAGGSDSDDVRATVAAMAERVMQLDAPAVVSAHHREVQAVHAKFCRSIDKSMAADGQSVLRLLGGGLDESAAPALNRAILQHLYACGQFEAARRLAQEAHLEHAASAYDAHEGLDALVGAVRAREVGPALAWAEANAEALAERSSNLRFALHRLHYLSMLREGGAAAVGKAIAYSRAHLAPCARAPADHAQVQQLMGALLYAGRLESSPYASVLHAEHWDEAVRTLTADFLALHGLAPQSHVRTALGAGALALPTLTKVAGVLQSRAPRTFASAERLPVELELPREYAFHSVFACPVSREQCSAGNPPMMLPCGHVLGRASISKLSRGCRTARFKCPYCPGEATSAQCRQLHV